MASSGNTSGFESSSSPTELPAALLKVTRRQLEDESSTQEIEKQLESVEALLEEAVKEDEIELSIVMPCLNEADTLAICIQKCNQVIEQHQLSAEVIIADNGSTDGSIEIARKHGARVVHVKSKGYGNALRGGIDEARGTYVIMGDADDSYNFLEIPKFVEALRTGKQLVQGCRLPAGGGRVLPGAMPFLHRWWGNPMFSAMVKTMFQAPIHDVYCGLRGFSKNLYRKLDLRCTGMEFATEMIIKASLFHRNEIAEVPITLHPDGRKSHAPHLRTFRDGWRTLRFFLIYSPKYLFQIPGIVMLLMGLIAYGLALPGVKVLGASPDAHTMLFGTLAILMGFQLVQFAIFSKTFAIEEGLMPVENNLTRHSKWFTLERGLIFGSAMFVFGSVLLGLAVNQWRLASFGALDYAQTMRIVIPGMTLAAIGFQTIASSFFLGVLKLGRREG